jgi:predicted RNA-binding protein with RPS1 domain
MKQNDTITVKVKNIQSYGVFVNYGLVDGFIHISKLSSKNIGDINKIVRIHQRLNVKVLEIQNDDRVAFTMV